MIGENDKILFKYFSEKNNKHIDFLLKVSIYEADPKTKTKMLLMDMGDDYTIYAMEITAINYYIKEDGEFGTSAHIDTEVEWITSNDEDETLEDVVLNMLINKLSYYSFGRNIGKVNSILDSNLVTIKLTNLDVMRGSNLICSGRG